MKLTLIRIVVVVMAVVLAGTAFACEGTRPLAMGGAFTGLADDANATYWNPAAIGMLKKAEATYTGTVYNRDTMNYDDWVSAVVPLDFSDDDGYGLDYGSIGISFMNNIDKGEQSLIIGSADVKKQLETTRRWYTLSYGRELKEFVEGLCIGANLRCNTYEEKLKQSATIGGSYYTVNGTSSDVTLECDIAAYYKWYDFSVGFLYQNINEAEMAIWGQIYKSGANFRPGIAYRFNDRYTLSAELYDAFNRADSFNFRLGGEALITENIALRIGGHDIASSEKTGRAITGGLGLLSGTFFDNVNVSLDYTVMYWYDAGRDTGDSVTHLLGASVKF